MSSVDYLREFVNERLTAAAEEIFRVFKRTVIEYEEEIDRQRRLLDNVWKPEIKLHRIELPQQHVGKEEEVLTDQQLCNQERNSSLDQEDPEPPQIKEEQEELCISQEGEQLVLKQEETDTFMLTPTHEENDHSEDQTLYLHPDKTLSVAETESAVSIPVKSSVVPEPNREFQLLFYNVAESQDQKEVQHGDLDDAEQQNTQQHESEILTNNIYNPTISRYSCNIHTGQTSYLHTGEPPYLCRTCGKRYIKMSSLKVHMRTHTGEKPYLCTICGKSFRQKSSLNSHITIHTGEKPFTCKICEKDFRRHNDLTVHMRTHTGEKPYSCDTCGKRFSQTSTLNAHIKTHTGEKPYSCDICGKGFSQISTLNGHIKIHTGEKLYSCNTCGKRLSQISTLKDHIRIHTGEKPYSCETCGRDFKSRAGLKNHMEIHIIEKL